MSESALASRIASKLLESGALVVRPDRVPLIGAMRRLDDVLRRDRNSR